jgi:hypothetical protein
VIHLLALDSLRQWLLKVVLKRHPSVEDRIVVVCWCLQVNLVATVIDHVLLLRQVLPRELRVLDKVSFTRVINDVCVLLPDFDKVHLVVALRWDLLLGLEVHSIFLLLHIHLIHQDSILILVDPLVLVK